MRRYQTLKIGLVLGLVPGLSACSSSPPSPPGSAKKAASEDSTARYLSGFELPLAGPLSKFATQQPPNNPRRTAIDSIPTATSGMDAYYAHGPSLIRYSVWLFPTVAEAKGYNWATMSSFTLPIADYTGAESIRTHKMRWKPVMRKQTPHQRRAARKYLIARLKKWSAPLMRKRWMPSSLPLIDQ